jgi:hypothetical protein
LQFLHSLWHAAPCRNELFLPVAEASSRSFAHLPRHGPRRLPTSGKPSSQPDEPTMPLTCIRKRSIDGLRCEGTWACAWGRWQNRSGIRGIECDHKFLRWQQFSQSKIVSDSQVNSRLQSTLTRARSSRSQSRINESLACRLSKDAALRHPVWGQVASSSSRARHVRLFTYTHGEHRHRLREGLAGTIRGLWVIDLLLKVFDLDQSSWIALFEKLIRAAATLRPAE